MGFLNKLPVKGQSSCSWKVEEKKMIGTGYPPFEESKTMKKEG